MANFGDIPSNIVLAAGQSIRRNAANDAFEAYTPGGGGSAYTFQHSLVEAAGVVNLVNDSASPGNSKYYGTNGSGTRGFYDLPIVPTFSNGLTLATGNVKLGGTLQNTTDIDVDDKSLWIYSSSGSLISIFDSDSVWLAAGNVNPGNIQNDIVISNTTLDIGRFTDSTSIVYSLTANGLVENADYSSIYGDRTLVARGWVNAQLTNKANWDTAYGWGNHASANYFKQSGNAFGAAAVLGTTDNYDLQLYANNIQWGVLKNTGEVGIGRETTAQQRLTVNYGNLRFNSIPQPSNHTASLAGVGAGNLSNGVYNYVVIPVTIYGDCGWDQRSFSQATVVDNTINGQIQLTNIPVFAAKYQVIARKIYRGKVGESNTSSRYLDIINDNTTTTYLDNTPDTSLPNGRVYGKPDRSTAVIYKNNALMMSADSFNTSFGQGALGVAVGADSITAIGSNAGGAITSAIGGIFIGHNAGFSITTGGSNVFIGSGGNGCTIGAYNIGIGGAFVTMGNIASYNIGIGREAGGLVTGDYNIYIGRYAGRYQGSGVYNIALGTNAFHGVSGTTPTGSYNLVMGYLAMGSGALTSAAQNTALGYLTLRYATTATGNVAVGVSAGTSITTGALNVFLGNSAGNSITEGSRNLILGTSVNVSSGTINDEFRLGYSTTLLLNGHMGTGPFLNVPVEFRTAGEVILNGIAATTQTSILYYNTTTKTVTHGAIPTPYTFQHSLTATGTTVNLVNDAASPGNSKYYGTNSGGTKGFYDLPSGGSMIYPGAGIAVSTGSAWGTSITDNSANWNTAHSWGNHAVQGYAKVNVNVLEVPVGSNVNCSIKPTGSSTDISIAIEPKGDGQVGFISNTVAYFGAAQMCLNSNNIDLAPDILGTGICDIYTSSQLSLRIKSGGRTNVKAGNLELLAGDGSGTGNGGDIFIYGGAGVVRGDIYFGSGSAGYLPAKSSETNVVYYNTSTGKLSYGTVSTGTTYTFQYSLTESAGVVNLVGDSASPGNSKLYGTNGSGTRGWYDIPAAGVTPVDGIWDWDTNVYKPYTSKQGSLHHFYAGTTNPDNTTRLNLDGHLYATQLYDSASRVITQATIPTGTVYENTLFAAVTMTTAGTWYTGATLNSLPAGRYLVTGNIVCQRSATTITIYTGRLRLVTGSYTAFPAQSQGNFSSQNPHLVNMSFSAIINIHTASNIFLEATANQSSASISASPSYSANAIGQTTYMRVIRLSDYVAASGSNPTGYITFAAGGSSAARDIIFNTQWYVASTPAWVSYSTATGVTQRVIFDASENDTGNPRFGDIVLKSLDDNFTLTISCGQDQI